MGDRRPPTSIRSVRMPDDLISELEKESQFQHISVNTLVNTIIYRYLEWERYAEKFGFIGLSRETFQAMISHMDEAELTTLAKSVSSTILKEFAFYSGEISGPKAFLDFIQKFCKYARFGEWEMRQDGPFYRASFLHRMGPRVSHYLSELYGDLLISVAGLKPEVEVLENEFIMKFTFS